MWKEEGSLIWGTNPECICMDWRKPRKKQLDTSLFLTFSTVHFPTIIQNNSVSAIDNLFIDLSKIVNYAISLLVNDLPDHDGQIIYINNINVQT